MRADARLDGHVVQGHVDGTGVVLGRARPASAGRSSGSALPAELARYVAEKGSIAVDGVSLTVTAVGAGLVRGRPDPRDPAGDDARAARPSATRSTSRSTCSPSTSSG